MTSGKSPDNSKSPYRGYEIRLRQEWSNWCASIHPVRQDVPMLALSPLHTLSLSPDEALSAAKRMIDETLGLAPEREVA